MANTRKFQTGSRRTFIGPDLVVQVPCKHSKLIFSAERTENIYFTDRTLGTKAILSCRITVKG